ncbi:conserved membrane protein of unknown function [Tenacibaculum sp. 190524A02b]|uniref:DUF2723 domain-containing protein n=1 Tax=Tenacibaculum vairaonense TaxID=3137860 RepID=A0ABM9PPM4_9FLAO
MKKMEQIIGWLLFVIVLVVYGLTMAPTISFWDSAEFVSSNYKLQVTHPPGAPLYMLISNVLISWFPAENIAFLSNFISGFFGALTVTIVYFLTKNLAYTSLTKPLDKYSRWLPSISGIVSGLTLAFIHSFWVASTETEVYTLSFFFLVCVWYIVILWKQTTNQKKELQLLLFAALLLGLSAGVHLINLSVVIPLSILFVTKKYKLSIKSLVIGLMAGVVLFLLIYGFVIQGFLKGVLHLDIYLVNELNFKVNTGLICLYIFLIILLLFAFGIGIKKKSYNWLAIIGCLLFFYIGVSTYGVSMIRANTVTPISNNPSNSLELLKYIRAEQFGVSKTPLLKGYYFNAPLHKNLPLKHGNPKLWYDKELKKYVEIDNGKFGVENYAKEFATFFPRMHSYKSKDVTGYKIWTTVKGKPISYDVMGKETTIIKPTFTENLSFFYNYQVDWLYARYLFWNFIGKQNDNKGVGTILNGNWISGFDFIDKHRVGAYSLMPNYYKNDLSRDVYYGIPFLIGLIGLWFLRKVPVHFFTSLLLFLTFGLGIIIYVNPVPTSILIRERDYIFIGSFIPFCIWIGLAVLQLYKWFSFVANKRGLLIVLSVLLMLIVPIQLLAKGWDDHNRSDDTFSRSLAKAYLDSCPKNSILITNGDNMTFPLWYLQEVEGYRTDVRVINFDQLALDWYIDKLRLTMNTSKKLSITLPKELYIKGTQEQLPLQKEVNQPVDLGVLFKFLSEEKTKKEWNGKRIHYIPSDVFSIKVDTSMFTRSDTSKALKLKYLDNLVWRFSKDFYAVNDLTLLNIIQENINDRPIAFAVNGNTNHYIGLQPYTIQQGMVEVLTPVKRVNPKLNPKIVDTNMMLPFFKEGLSFKGFKEKDKFIDYENRVYTQQIVRRNYYFLAQALLEEDNSKEAVDILNTSMFMFPNVTVPFKQYAFAMGKLYFKAGNPKKGNEVCLKAMNNLKEELLWLISFNPPNPIINVRYANRVKGMYIQMIEQYSSFNEEKGNDLKMNFKNIDKSFQNWQAKNWPY